MTLDLKNSEHPIWKVLCCRCFLICIAFLRGNNARHTFSWFRSQGKLLHFEGIKFCLSEGGNFKKYLILVADLTRRNSRMQMDTTAVRRSFIRVSVKWWATSQRILRKSWVWTTAARPKTSGNWVTVMTIAAPEVKPDITGVEKKFIKKPARKE